jgi:putative addiction module CopG family antidote
MTFSLSKEQERLIQNLVLSGRYETDSEVVSNAFRLLQEHETKLSEFQAEIQKGRNRGETTPLDMAAIEAKARELQSK